jgi:transketolase
VGGAPGEPERSPARDEGRPTVAFWEAAAALAERWRTLRVVDAGLPPSQGLPSAIGDLGARYVRVGPPEAVGAAVDGCRAGGPLFLGAPVPFFFEGAFPELVRTLVVPRANAKLVGFPPEPGLPGSVSPPCVRDDLATMRGLPSMTVVVPADGPTTRAATSALAERAGPAYLRLPDPDARSVTAGAFAVGRAQELRAGNDLAILALGRTVAPALAVADDLARVGIAVRVLDAASVKPFDEAAVLRAARDTGAILVLEAGPLAAGIGTLVAAMTAENYPVPVRRVGLADVWPDGGGGLREEALGLAPERLRDEAWELLRLRGRVP